MSDVVRMPSALCDGMLQHAIEAAPEECCGLLLGHSGEVIDVVRAANVAADPLRRYQVDPAAHFAAIRRGRAAGFEVIGAYHSHPRGPAVPSETDRAQAYEDPSFVHVLVAPQLRQIAAYRLITGNFVAVPLVRVP